MRTALVFGMALGISLCARGAKPAAPFSARGVTNYYDSSGKLTMTVSDEYFRYSDHSSVSRSQRQYPSPGGLLTIIRDWRTGREVHLDAITRSVTTLSFRRFESESFTLSEGEESCFTEDVRDATPGGVLFGHPTLYLVQKWSPTLTIERWMIPELDCYPIKEIQSNRAGHLEMIVESLVEGEPDRSLIATPDGYTERSAAAVDELRAKVGAEPAFGFQRRKQMEREYQRRKVK